MSGFVGIVRLDGGPVDATLVGRMTDAMRYRGPDRQSTWVDGAAGFGHALLRTASDARHDPQPLTLDRQAWIVADARLDGRQELIAALRARGRVVETAGDAALILHAYHVWHDRCVDHLRGDFAFAIWDVTARRLLAARDHFGVKPLYYACSDGAIVVSNTLRCLRMYPQLGDRLDDHAIADFLMFGANQDPTSSIFAGIRKVEPASTIACSAMPASAVVSRRYWSLPLGGRVRYRRSHEYVDHFNQLLDQAVTDRLGDHRAGIWMSGGLDSTAIAASARRQADDGACRLAAHTVVYDSLIPDHERRYAREVARVLDVPIEFLVADEYRPLAGWERQDLSPPEPIDEPFLSMRNKQLRRAAMHSRVWLGGDGGDELLLQSYVLDLAQRMPVVELGSDLVRTLARRCRPGVGLRARLHAWRGRCAPIPPLPDWVDRGFAARVNMEDRWRQVHAAGPVGTHALRPEAQGRLAAGQWASSFEAYDPGATGVLVEYRTPFLDLRLVEFGLAIPPLPWCVKKHLLRVALRGVLPSAVRHRPKTPLAVDPVSAHLSRSPLTAGDVDLTGQILQYVHAGRVRQQTSERDQDPWLHLRPLYLGHWLRHER
jgi:asparagine synthase (glutamine-hydrolysing)